MPKKKPFKMTGLQWAGLAIAGVIMAGVAGFSYAKANDKTIAVGVGGQRVGVYFDDDTGAPFVAKGKYGCCTPYCASMFEIECSQEYGLGVEGSQFYEETSCQDIDECQKGCCLPACEDSVTKIQCNGDYMAFGGDWRANKCEEITECEKGCCRDDGEYIDNIAQAFCMRNPENSWKAGECGTGYEAKAHETGEMVLTASRSMGEAIGNMVNKAIDKSGKERQLTWTVDLEAFTCNESVESEWHVNLMFHTSANENAGIPQAFYVDFAKQKSYSLDASFMLWSNKFYEIALEENQIKVQFDTNLSDKPIVVYAPIQKGAEACKKKG